MRHGPTLVRRAGAVLALILGVLALHGVLEVLDASGHAHPTERSTVAADTAESRDDGHHELATSTWCAPCVAAVAAVTAIVASVVWGFRPPAGAAPDRATPGWRLITARAHRPHGHVLALLQVCLR